MSYIIIKLQQELEYYPYNMKHSPRDKLQEKSYKISDDYEK